MTAPGVVRLASWNLRSGLSLDRRSLWWTRRRRVAEVLHDVDADLWCFQEVFGFQRRWLLRHGLAAAPWGHAGEGRNRWRRGEAVPVMWRERGVRPLSATTLWMGREPARPGTVAPGASSPRVATAVDLDLAGVGPARVVNTHLDTGPAEVRHRAAEQLAAWAAARDDDLPLVIAGDLNATLDDAELAPLLAAGLRSVLPDDAGPTATAFETEVGRRLDHVLVSHHWEVVSAEVAHRAGTASDHYPVVAELRLR